MAADAMQAVMNKAKDLSANSMSSMSSMTIPPSLSNTMASVKASAGTWRRDGESHFLEETMNPGRVRQYLNAPKGNGQGHGHEVAAGDDEQGRDASEFSRTW